MTFGTPRLLALGLLALVVGTTSAQTKQVTFQVDMTSAISNCRFAQGTDKVYVRGSFNSFGTTDELTDADGDKIYTKTIAVAPGAINYKFYATPEAVVGWEDNEPTGPTADNRDYVVTDADAQTIPVVTFNKAFTNGCTAVTSNYEVLFQVDMSVARLRTSTFNPATDVVTVAGAINGWNTTRDTLRQDFQNPDLYTGFVRSTTPLSAPDPSPYKFVIRKKDQTSDFYESGDNRTFQLTGTEPDANGDGFKEVTVPTRYYNDVTPQQVFTTATTITFEVDLRPAFYYLKDNNRLPNDTQTGDPVTTLTGVWLNGPAAGRGDGLTDWATWGPTNLGAIASRKLVDDGTNGDATAGDSVYTLRFNYSAGTERVLVGKFGTDGYDNEAGFGGDQNFDLTRAVNGRFRSYFGAVRRSGGRYTDQRGPASASRAYDPYLAISSDSMSVTVVRRGASAVGVEDTGLVPNGLVLSTAAPNPFRDATRFRYTVPMAGPVSLRVYDLMGRAVATLVDGPQAASTYEATLDGRGLAAGMYVVRLAVGGQTLTRSIVLTR